MRIIVCDLSTGSVDILNLDKEAEEYVNSIDNMNLFLEQCGYNPDEVQWMEVKGLIQEQSIYMNGSYPRFDFRD